MCCGFFQRHNLLVIIQYCLIVVTMYKSLCDNVLSVSCDFLYYVSLVVTFANICFIILTAIKELTVTDVYRVCS
jgi:hypothetical protein